MSLAILVLGHSGSGKTTSIRNLDPQETFIFNVIGKTLPFRAGSKYKSFNKESKTGNMLVSQNADIISKGLDYINENMKNVKNVIIDDFQYVMSFEFMERAKERGFDKFTEIGQNAFNILKKVSQLRDDLNVIVLSHLEQQEGTGIEKMKTIGKILDEKITPEGLFPIVFVTRVLRDESGVRYIFQTNIPPAKSPIDMFPEIIDNDLAEAIKIARSYYQEEQPISKKLKNVDI